MVDATMDGLAWVRKQVEQADTDLLREMVKLFCERVMGEEADAICGAPYGERSDERTNRRNGYRSRPWDTRTGTIDLAVPKLREGSYFPDWCGSSRRKKYETGPRPRSRTMTTRSVGSRTTFVTPRAPELRSRSSG